MLIRSFAAATAARLAFAAFAIFAFSAAAEAANITFVAANGNDANPCTVITAPCKTLQRAYTVTPINGTINVLTSLDTATLAINKNITVVGNGVAIVGSIVIGTSSTNAVVTLRGLALNGAKIYTNGIRIDAAAAVHIEDCTVERYNSDGIKLTATTATKLFVSNTVSRDNTGYGLYFTDVNARVTVETSRFENNGNAGLHLAAARANVTRSVASGNNTGIVLYSGTAKVTETTAADNPSYGFLSRYRQQRDPDLLGGPRQRLWLGYIGLRLFGDNYRFCVHEQQSRHLPIPER